MLPYHTTYQDGQIGEAGECDLSGARHLDTQEIE